MYKVLIADDEPLMLEGLKSIIDWKALGFTVCATAEDGQEALEKIIRLSPDLVMMMPVIDGADTMAKAREAGYEGFFIVLSGASDFTYAQKAIRSSASFYLTKPVDEDELADAVKEVAERLDAKRDTDSRLVRNATGNVISRLLSGTYDPAEDHLDDFMASSRTAIRSSRASRPGVRRFRMIISRGFSPSPAFTRTENRSFWAIASTFFFRGRASSTRPRPSPPACADAFRLRSGSSVSRRSGAS